MKTRRGHFCWSCRHVKPNEAFSAKGHRRHVCRECASLGKAELKYRQAERDIDRLCGESGCVRRQHRKTFERFLAHDDARIRAYAESIAEHDRRLRAKRAEEREAYDESSAAFLDALTSPDGIPAYDVDDQECPF